MRYTISNSYPRRFARLMLGLLLCGTGTYMTVQATAIGIGAWETFQTGLAMRTGFSFGNCTVMVSFAVIAVDLLLGGKIGFGTLINAVMIGKTVDFFHAFCDFLPATDSIWIGSLYLILGRFMTGYGMVLYMSPALGCGPRDTLMVVLAKRFPDRNIGTVRFLMEIAVFVAGVLLGAPYGIGTIVATACQSYIMAFVFQLCHFESRTVPHENVLDTIRIWRGTRERTQ